MFSENNTHADEHYDLRVAGSFKIGRSPLCNVILKDGHVSKVHCSFNICNKDDPSSSVGSKSQVLISDHSSNGTWISSKGSGETIKLEQGKPTLLKEGDIIFLTRSTATSPDVITYKYCSFPFPKITKFIYNPEQPLHEQNAGVLKCQTENDIEDDKTSTSIHLKRKLESDGRCISPRKVRFKEQIEESIDSHESLIGNSVKSVENSSVSAEGSSTKKRSNPTIHADKSTPLENAATTGDNEDQCTTDSNITHSHVSTSSSTDHESPSGIPEFIKSNKKCDSPQDEDITKRSECDQANGFSAPEDDIHYDKCALCGKWIPHVTASLHEAVCVGQSQEAKSEDHVSLSSVPFENYSIREESNPNIQSPEKLLTKGEENGLSVRSGVSEQDTIGEVNSSGRDPNRIQDEACEKKILKTPTTLPSASCHLSGKSTNSETTSTSSKKDTIGEVNSSDRDPDRVQDETCEKKILKTPTTLPSASCFLSGKSTNSETISTSSKHDAIGEVNSGDRDPDRIQDETCKKKILKTPTTLPSASCRLSGESTNSDTINTSTDTVCEANENVEESTVTKIPTSTREQREPPLCSYNGDAGSTSPHEGEPMLEREESKERCTFCSKVLLVSELISHASECSKMSAVFPADSDDTENMHEACPYCGKYFEVLELVEHVNYCKDLSRTKAEAALLEDDFTSSPELEGSFEDPSVIDSELCPKCRREFPLLELLKHATECKQEEPLSTASYVESPREDTNDRLEANDADGSKATVRSSDDICGSCDDLDRDKSELNDEVCSSGVTCGDKDNPIAGTEHDVDSDSASDDVEVDEGGGDRKDEEDKAHVEENDRDNDANVEDDNDSSTRRDTGDDDVVHAGVYHEADHNSGESSLSSESREDFKDDVEELDQKDGESSTVSDGYSKSGGSGDDSFDDDNSSRRRDTGDDDVTHSDGYNEADHNSDESNLSNESKENFKDNEDDLDEKYGKSCTRSDSYSNSGGCVDDCVDAAKNSEDDVGSDEFEFCPNCRELFHLSLLVEHASNCLRRDLSHGIKTSESEKLTGFGKSASFDPAAGSSFVFSDCHFCGIRLPVHVMSIHYPKCEKLHLERGSSGGSSRLKESSPAQGLPGYPSHIDNSSSRITIKDDTSTKRPIGLTKTSDFEESSTSSKSKKARFHAAAATVAPPPAATADDDDQDYNGDDDDDDDRKASENVLKRTTSSLDSYHDCEEQCMYCLKMFPVSVLVEHACNCTGRQESSADASSELEQCCYCLRAFPLNELIDHAQNCEQKTVSSSQDVTQDDVIANSQSETGEVLERCMYCFKDFPVSKLIRHSQKCDGDMSGPRERFQGFLPSVHDLSAVSSVAILNDTQRAALQYVITRSAEDSKRVASKLLARVQRLGYTENDLKRTLQWVRSAAPIIIHINLDRVLKFLVKDTHYRNRFETGTSGGSTDKVARKSWEDRIFNKAYHSSIPSERVKYGVLNIVGDPRGVRSCIHYGDSFLQLKKVRLRATFASMDTSGAGVKLSCCEHYENVLFSYTDREITAIMDVANGKVPFHRSDCILHYKEVQIHGPVSLSENVECIVVNARHQGDPRTTSLLDRFVEQNKCNLIWMDPDDYAGAAPHFGMVPGFTTGAAPIFGMGTGLTAGAMGAAPFCTSDTLDRLRSLSDSLSHPARRGRGRGRSKSRRKHPY